MAVCRKCNQELILGQNWMASSQRWHSHICKSCLVKLNKNWRHANPDKVSLYNKNKWKGNPEGRRASKRTSERRLKIEVFSYYSGTNPPQCANPYGQHKEPYTDIRALSLDLLAGGHRKSGLPRGRGLHYRLRREKYPDGWQVLCMNCQFIKREINDEMKDKPTGRQY
jgi:RNase P subunit RPR2